MELEIFKRAKAARELAYAPYSKFKVGSSLLCKNGDIFSGCNVENVSYGATICAERNCITQAVCHGNKDFEKIFILTDINPPSPPCALCLQVMVEFCSEDFQIYLCDTNSILKKYNLFELIPHPFKKF